MSDHKAHSPVIANPTRTAVQLAPSVVITEFVDAFVYDFDERQYAAFAGILLLAFSVVQNYIEVKRNKALLKPKPT